MNVIVLAGNKKVNSSSEDSNNQKDLNVQIGNKALLRLKDKYMIEYIIDTLRNSSVIGKIAVVGPKEQLEPIIGDKVDYIVEGTDSIVTNGLLAMENFKNDKQVLITTSDIPMLTVEALEDFISKALDMNADLCYSVVDKLVNDKKYPEVKRTYARLWEGQFTGGNIFLFNPAVTEKCKTFVEQMLEYRKSPAKMAMVLGFGFLIRMALGILTINAVQKKTERLLGIKGAVVISEYPEVGNDVDKMSDVQFVEKYL
ncbi:MAG TPA: nucleotidyltransferase family protein [Patescibacteria group bacterium]|jgi:GTP:adenosylcobinamide-phosphate guanylyltransferase|nr:nucleotidyltransferase family protein [Patescibacteria group bacterium]